ncbi:MAG: hypothetical protein IKZ11_01190 [Alistipes sp.]|nr:hypothetical protein [Alistipes sp.]
MDNIISAERVIELAFADGGYIPKEIVSQADIRLATERWVKPVVGQELLQRVLAGDYVELREEYIVPVVALYTRLVVQPKINVMSSFGGLTSAHSSSRKASDETSRKELQSRLREDAHSLLRALSDYLNQNQAQFKEYKKSENILNRCSTDGGFVQIF